MRSLRSFFTAVFVLSVFSLSARAQEEQIRLYRGIRSMGMGGVVTTTGDYAEALFGNPARHSEAENAKLSIFDLTASANDKLISTAKDTSKLSGGSGSSTIAKASDLIGKNQHARVDYLTAYYNPRLFGDLGFALGLLVSTQANLVVHYTTDIGTQFVTNAGPNAGFSHRFLEDKLSLGVNLHALYRVATDGRVSAIDFLTGSKGLKVKDLADQGMGLDADLGAYYFVPLDIRTFKLGLGASLNNVLQSHYRNWNPDFVKGLGHNPPASDRLLNLGARVDMSDAWILREPLVAFELQDIGATSKRYSFFKRVHFGGEAKLTRLFALRAGMNQGYACGGFGLNLPLLKIEAATYGEELSGNAGVLEDRRYMLRLALEL